MHKAASRGARAGRGVGRVRSTDEGGESRWREGALLEDATSARKELGIVATLRTPEKLRELQRALYLRAKREPSFRAYALFDKVYRQDVLTHAFALCKANGGAPGTEGEAVPAWTGEAGVHPEARRRRAAVGDSQRPRPRRADGGEAGARASLRGGLRQGLLRIPSEAKRTPGARRHPRSTRARDVLGHRR